MYLELKSLLARCSDVRLHLHNVLLRRYGCHSHLQRMGWSSLSTISMGHGAHWSCLSFYCLSDKALLWFLSKQIRKFENVNHIFFFDLSKFVSNCALFSFDNLCFIDRSSFKHCHCCVLRNRNNSKSESLLCF